MGNRGARLGPCVVALLALAGCHRTALVLGESDDVDAGRVASADAALAADVAPARELGTDQNIPPDGVVGPDLGTTPEALPPDAPTSPDAALPPPTPGCTPRPEICNGADDDCDGKVDEDQAAIPCPNGGSRYCVAGKLSECPRVCDACRPGSQRVCFISYCTYWGTQTCAADGRSFGLCREAKVPAECESIAGSKKKSAELERCCLDSGYCCRDEYDLDGDGDRTEMLGRCGAVACPP
jgi:hypothetical protein